MEQSVQIEDPFATNLKKRLIQSINAIIILAR